MSRAVQEALKAWRLSLATNPSGGPPGPLYGLTFRTPLDDDRKSANPPRDLGDGDPTADPPVPPTPCPMPPARSELTVALSSAVHRSWVQFKATETITLLAITDAGVPDAAKIAEAMRTLIGGGRQYTLLSKDGKIVRARIVEHQALDPIIIQPAEDGTERGQPGGSPQVVITWIGRASWREI